MYQNLIQTVAAIIAALTLAAQLNLLQPAQPVQPVEEFPSLLYQVRADRHKVQNPAPYGAFYS